MDEGAVPCSVCPCCLFSWLPGAPFPESNTQRDAVLWARYQWYLFGMRWRSTRIEAPVDMRNAIWEHLETRLWIRYLCPVCGSEDEMPARDHEICEGCGTQFEYSDYPNFEAGITRDMRRRDLRADWLADGPVYWRSKFKEFDTLTGRPYPPADWTPESARARLAEWEASGQEFGPYGPWYLADDAKWQKRLLEMKDADEE